MINQYLSSELNLVGDFHDAKHFCEDHFFILVYLLNCSICLVSHTDYLAILLLSCMKLIKLEDIINHWKLTINLRVGSKWPITGYIIVNLSLSFFILSVVYVGLFNWENSLKHQEKSLILLGYCYGRWKWDFQEWITMVTICVFPVNS